MSEGFVLHIRWIVWIAILIALIKFLYRGKSSVLEWIDQPLSDEKFKKILVGICSLYFVLGFAAKVSQLWSFKLNSQDFWLFADILEQAKKGGIFLTRFAPQGIGVVQHGTVHPMYTWLVMVPFAFLFGSTTAALIFNPFFLGAAGGVLGLLGKNKWGNKLTLFLVVAFLSSTQLGKILMYDVHPEAAYPFFVFLWLWGLGLDAEEGEVKPKVRWVALIVATLGAIGIKEDSVFVLGPWMAYGIIFLKGDRRKATWISTILGGITFLFLIWSVHQWSRGYWGPQVWEGDSVIRTAGISLFRSVHLTGPQAVFQVLGQLVSEHDGGIGWFKNILGFLISRPWLSLVVFAPWVLFLPRFWFVILPLVCVYSLLDSPKILWNYYSAPFLGSFWFCLLHFRFPSRIKQPLQVAGVWCLLSSLFLGSGGIEVSFASRIVKEMRRESDDLVSCLRQKPGLKNGIVPSYLLGSISLDRVHTDRVPRDLSYLNRVDFVLFSPLLDRYEVHRVEAETLFRFLNKSSAWSSISPWDCRFQANTENLNQRVFLFVKNRKNP